MGHGTGNFEEFRNHTLAIVRGGRAVDPNAPKIWVECDAADIRRARLAGGNARNLSRAKVLGQPMSISTKLAPEQPMEAHGGPVERAIFKVLAKSYHNDPTMTSRHRL